MSMQFTYAPATDAFAPAAHVIARALRAGWQALVRRYEERRAIARLRSMDSRMLADIGLSRGQIEGAVRGTDPDVLRPSRAGVPAPGASSPTGWARPTPPERRRPRLARGSGLRERARLKLAVRESGLQ